MGIHQSRKNSPHKGSIRLGFDVTLERNVARVSPLSVIQFDEVFQNEGIINTTIIIIYYTQVRQYEMNLNIYAMPCKMEN